MKSKIAEATRIVSCPVPLGPIRMDEILWEFAQYYREKLAAESRVALTNERLVAAAMRSFEEAGIAVRRAATDGTIVFKATPKFLSEIGHESGDVVTIDALKNIVSVSDPASGASATAGPR